MTLMAEEESSGQGHVLCWHAEQFPLHETINFTRKEKNIPPPGL